MTYRFHSQAWGDVLMLQPAGDELLAAMGLAPARRGLIAPEAIPGLLAALQAAIEHEGGAEGEPGTDLEPVDESRSASARGH